MAPARTPCQQGASASIEVPLLALFFLVFLQLLTDFVAGIYAFGLLRTSVPPQIACVALLAAPVGLVVFRRLTPRFVVLTGFVMLLSRIASLFLDTPGRMLTAGVGTTAFLLCFPARLWLAGKERDHRSGPRIGIALALATLTHSCLHTLGSGNDLTRLGAGRFLGAALAFVTGALLWAWGRNATQPPATEPAHTKSAGSWRLALVCLGINGVLGLLYLGMATPMVVTRWTAGDAVWITAAATGPLVTGLALVTGRPAPWRPLSSGAWFSWNLLFLCAWSVALGSSRVSFPTNPQVYPFAEPPVGLLGRGSLLLMLVLSPVLYVNAARYTRAVIDAAPSVRTLGLGFALGSLGLLVLVLAQVFTTTYDYIPWIGPWFRDRFWLVMTAAGAVATLPALLVSRKADALEPIGTQAGTAPVVATAVMLAAGTIGATALDRTRPGSASPGHSLRVMTYNLQQGYNAQGARNFTGQLEAIRRMNPDVVGLQETDTARVAGGNSDLVRFLAAGLGYQAHAGPRTAAGTFGIALLSRYPMARAQTFYLDSTGEQTAVIEAELTVGETTYSVCVTHLGNGGPALQQRQVLGLLAGKTNVVLMGDFNFSPDTEPYRLTTAVLEDAWSAARKQHADPPDQDLNRRIDHVFVSPNLGVHRAEYQDHGESDHPAVVVDIEAEGSTREWIHPLETTESSKIRVRGAEGVPPIDGECRQMGVSGQVPCRSQSIRIIAVVADSRRRPPPPIRPRVDRASRGQSRL